MIKSKFQKVNLLVVKLRLVYATDSFPSKTVYAWTWYVAPGVKSLNWYWNEPSSIGIVRFVPTVSDRPSTFNLYDVKFPCDGGLHDMIAVLPLRTATDRFDGGSGAEMIETGD